MCLLTLLLVSCSPGGFSSQESAKSSFTLQQPPKARQTYVAIGASDTFGQGTDDPQTESWPYVLMTQLGKGVRLINLGIPGMHLHDALSVELPVAIDAHPDLITIWLAVNDLVDNVSLPSYQHDLDLLLTRLQTATPHARIVVANVPDITLLPRFQSLDHDKLRQQINSYNTSIASVVTRHQVTLVDLYQKWNELATHPEYVSSDGFHPNATGYARLAQIFYQVLQKR